MTARFFLPLAGEPFDWFSRGRKRWELRGYGARFNPRQLILGKEIELRRGYSGKDRLWGTIGQHVVADSIDEIFDLVNFRLIVPNADNKQQAADSVARILGPKSRYIAFEVVVRPAARTSDSAEA